MWYQIGLEILRDVSVIVAAATAVYGLGSWRRRRDAELAEDVLCLFYKAERAIQAIRWPAYDLRDGQNREPAHNETREEKQARDRANVVFDKIRKNSDVFAELDSLRFRFMARFGKDKAGPFDDIRGIVSEIWVSAQELAELWATELRRGQVADDTREQIKTFEKVIRYSGKGDKINTRLSNIVTSIEGICRPIIEGKWRSKRVGWKGLRR